MYQTNAQLIEQLRKYLADQAWLENKRILEIIRGIEKSALELKERDPSRFNQDFTSIDQPKVAVNLLMEPRLFEPGRKTVLNSDTPPTGHEDIDVSALYQQHWVDEAALHKNIRRLLQTRPQASLKEVLASYPLRQGLAELVVYLNIASKTPQTVINESITETLTLNSDPSSTAAPAHHLQHRIAHIPQIIFTR